MYIESVVTIVILRVVVVRGQKRFSVLTLPGYISEHVVNPSALFFDPYVSRLSSELYTRDL